jgi:glycosyltransferase involved in cell wall biosynthesis
MNMTINYSVIIPAYNEEQWLPDTLTALREAMGSLFLQGEVIVVDNNSTDRTPQIAREENARVVFEPVNQISRARNTGAKVAKGRYLIFIDADTIVSSALLQTALDNLSGGRCCGGGSLVDFDKPLRPLARRSLDLWNWVSMKFGFAAGCFIYCLREGFEAVGGFSQKVYASEEIWFSNRLQSWGNLQQKAFHIITSPRVVTSSRKLEWYSPVQLGLTALMTTVFPFSLRFRNACSFWYWRPNKP